MKKLIILSVLTSFFFACKQDETAALKQKLVEIDKAIGGAAATDKTKAAEFIQISEALAVMLEKSNPDQYVEVLLKAAGLAKTIGNPIKAIELYTKVAAGMPQHTKAPTALFLIGFVQENDLNDLVAAKATYESFLRQYPNDPDFADDAVNALKQLGKSPDEIVKEFEKQEASQ